MKNEIKVPDCHYFMNIKLHLLLRCHSAAVLIQSCKVFTLTIYYLRWNGTVCCNCKTECIFPMKRSEHYSSKT